MSEQGSLRGRLERLSIDLAVVLDLRTYTERLDTADDLGLLAVLLRALLEHGLPAAEDPAHLHLFTLVAALEPRLHSCAGAVTKRQRRHAVAELRTGIEVSRDALDAAAIHLQQATSHRLDRSSLVGEAYADAIASAARHIEDRVTALERAISSARRAEEQRQASYDTMMSEFVARSAEDAGRAMARLDQLIASYESLVEQVGRLRIGVALDHLASEAARQEKRELRAYRLWQTGAVGSAVLGVGLLIWASYLGSPSLGITDVYRHLTAVAAIAGVATYCARQARALHWPELVRLSEEHRVLRDGTQYVDTRDALGPNSKELFGLVVALNRFARPSSPDGTVTDEASSSALTSDQFSQFAEQTKALLEGAQQNVNALLRTARRRSEANGRGEPGLFDLSGHSEK